MFKTRSSRPLDCGLLSASALTLVLALTLEAQAGALPGHGHFVSGQGSIGKASQSVTVKQSSTTGIIDWNKFSVGKANSVRFDNGSGATLNRVTGGNLSTIAGSLHATGSLYLMNAQGVIVSGAGHVVTGGSFVASTSNGAFGSEDNRFKVGSGRVVNKGTIIAGGAVSLGGSDVSDTGTIHASRVDLQAQKKLAIDGTIAARNADGSGGTVIATAKHIGVGSATNVSASGTKGGTVLIGGDIHGGAVAHDNFVGQSVRTAQTTAVAAGAHISADGDSTGGNIVIWSDGRTSFAGQVSAKGQTAGGFAEVSSHDLLGFTGTVDLTAAHGTTGTLLLDPYNVTIAAHGNSHESGFKATGNNSVINVKTLTTALKKANIVVSTGSGGKQTGDITVDAAITWSSASTLTLDAYRDIAVKKAITGTGKGNLVLRPDFAGTGVGAVDFSGTGVVNFSKDKGYVIIFYDPSDNPAHSKVNSTSYTAPENFSADVKTNKSLKGQMLALMLVNSVYDLQNIQNNVQGDYALGRNINAAATKKWNLNTETSTSFYEGFIPIAPTGFSGILDGLGHTISNLYEETGILTAQSGGLFAMLAGGEVANTIMTNVDLKLGGNALASGALVGDVEAGSLVNDGSSGSIIYLGGTSVGGLAGENDGTVTESHSNVTVDAASAAEGSNAGGLIGLSYGSVTSSHASGKVIDEAQDANVGGLVGFNNALEGDGYIDASYATGAVTGGSSQRGGSSQIGGLVGYNMGDGSSKGKPGEILSSYATGTVTDAGMHAFIGGLVGENDNSAELLKDYAKGAVTSGSDGSAGGLTGVNNGVILEDYARGKVTAGRGNETGGLVGLNTSDILESFATGDVISGATDSTNAYEADAGGLVGRNQGGIGGAYATGSVSVGATTAASEGAIAYAGGLVGDDYGGTLDQVYETGAVKGGSKARIGGLSGRSGASVTAAYWDITTSKLKKSAEGKGRTTGELKSKLPPGFAKKYWKIRKGSFPYLAWQKSAPKLASARVMDGGGLLASQIIPAVQFIADPDSEDQRWKKPLRAD